MAFCCASFLLCKALLNAGSFEFSSCSSVTLASLICLSSVALSSCNGVATSAGSVPWAPPLSHRCHGLRPGVRLVERSDILRGDATFIRCLLCLLFDWSFGLLFFFLDFSRDALLNGADLIVLLELVGFLQRLGRCLGHFLQQLRFEGRRIERASWLCLHLGDLPILRRHLDVFALGIRRRLRFRRSRRGRFVGLFLMRGLFTLHHHLLEGQVFLWCLRCDGDLPLNGAPDYFAPYGRSRSISSSSSAASAAGALSSSVAAVDCAVGSATAVS